MLLDSQKFNSQVIASAFGVPALFVNLPVEGGLTYQSPGMLGEHWWRVPAPSRVYGVDDGSFGADAPGRLLCGA